MNILDGYLWGYKNWQAGDKVIKKFKEFYPDGQFQIIVDLGGDLKNYKKISKKYKTHIKENPFKIGYPGNHQDHNVGRDCWPKEETILWLKNIYDFCLISKAKYIIILEEDSFILKPISILQQNFDISVFEYNTNHIPKTLIDVVDQLEGNTNIPLNKFGVKGYGAGGGFIINRQKWIESFEKFIPILDLNFDRIKEKTHLVGWSDCIAQILIMVGGGEVLQNPQMVQTWYHERPDLYPTYTHWKDYEIVDYIKDYTIIE